MALKRPSTLLLSLPSPTRAFTCIQCRHMHRLNAPTQRIPQPTPFVPDVPTFLTLIGRNLSSHASKIPSWDALFSLSSAELKDAGVEPPRARRYLLWWRERFRNGIQGIGGDLKEVKDGVAELRIVEVKSGRAMDQAATLTKGAGMRKVIVNVTPTVSLPKDPAKPVVEEEVVPGSTIVPSEPQKIEGMRIVQGSTVAGTGVEPVKGYRGVARLRVQEGLWEERRGHKVDGGERRKAEVRYKRVGQERKNAR